MNNSYEDINRKAREAGVGGGGGSTPPPDPSTFPEPEDRSEATPSAMGGVEYVGDLLRPGRIMVVAAEEGTGKSYTVDGELAMRLAAAGDKFAQTWPVKQTGPVLILSEMTSDEDLEREDMLLAALHLKRADLKDRYYRLSLGSAAGGKPPLDVPEWRDKVLSWLQKHEALALIVDTASMATDADPWGPKLRDVFRRLWAMRDAYPALAIVLVVHFKKPSGRGLRAISDVMGEWGRFADVVMLMQDEGGFDRVLVTVRKRVRQQRRLSLRKEWGLLVDPEDVETSGVKIPLADFLATVRANPGLNRTKLAKKVGVTRGTLQAYIDAAGPQVTEVTGARNAKLIYAAGAAPQPVTRQSALVSTTNGSMTGGVETPSTTRHPSPLYRGDGSGDGSPPGQTTLILRPPNRKTSSDARPDRRDRPMNH